MNKAIKYRVYPTTKQCVLFVKTFGCCRKVYNLMLSDKIEEYKATGKFPALTPAKYKKDYPYLKEVVLCQDLRQLKYLFFLMFMFQILFFKILWRFIFTM